MAVAAAYELLRRLGWPCALQLAGQSRAIGASLAVWDIPVLASGDGVRSPERTIISGPPVAVAAPYVPDAADHRVAQTPVTGPFAAALTEVLGQLGGDPQVVPAGARVLLKANFNSYHAPPASTSLDLLTAVVAELRHAGAAHVALGECSAIALGRTRGVLERAGVAQWARESEVELVCFDEGEWHSCPVPGRHFHHIVVPACLQQYDRLIYLVSPKTHHQAGVSLGLKMTVGFMHPAQRLELHRDHLTERIADVALAVQPHLLIADARQCFITGGPAEGDVAAPGLLLASRDLCALEEAGLELLAQHGATGLELGRQQLAAFRKKGAGEEVLRG